MCQPSCSRRIRQLGEKRNMCHHKFGSLWSSVAPGQLTGEGGRAECASCYFTHHLLFSIRRKYRRSPAVAVILHSPTVATTDTAVSLAKNTWPSVRLRLYVWTIGLSTLPLVFGWAPTSVSLTSVRVERRSTPKVYEDCRAKADLADFHAIVV